MPEIPPLYGERERREADALYSRVFEAAGCTTQNELAELLDIRQSSISDAKRRGTVPSDWLVKLLRLRGINPDWVIQGRGPKFLVPGDGAKDTTPPDGCSPAAATLWEDFLTVRKILRSFPVRDLVDELRRRGKTNGENGVD